MKPLLSLQDLVLRIPFSGSLPLGRKPERLSYGAGDGESHGSGRADDHEVGSRRVRLCSGHFPLLRGEGGSRPVREVTGRPAAGDACTCVGEPDLGEAGSRAVPDAGRDEVARGGAVSDTVAEPSSSRP